MKIGEIRDHPAFQLSLAIIISFLVVFLPQRLFIQMSFRSMDHNLWNEDLMGGFFGTRWLFAGSAILFLVTFLTCLLSSFVISIAIKEFKIGFVASILVCIMAVSPTILVFFTFIISTLAFSGPFYYTYRYELSLVIILSAISGATGGSVYGNLLFKNELDLPPKDPVLAQKRMELMQKGFNEKSIIFLIVGIACFATFHLAQTDMGNTHGNRIILGSILVASVPLMGYGYISLINRIELKTGCLIDGIAAIVIPQILVIVHLLRFMQFSPSKEIFALILVLGVVSFCLSVLGYYFIRGGNLKRGLKCKKYLILTLTIGSALVFLISGFEIYPW